MEMIPVESSRIATIGYDKENQILRVKFHRGGTYEYQPVFEYQYDMLVKAESVGKTFQTEILNDPTIDTNKLT